MRALICGLGLAGLALCACKREPATETSDAGAEQAPPTAGDAPAAEALPEDEGDGNEDAGTAAIVGAVDALRIPSPGAPRERSPASGGAVDIPAGSYLAGSAPGDESRDPIGEPTLVPMEQTAYSIDALPFPGEPGSAPKLVSSAHEAASLCESKGARLCSEWEWERACRGPELEPFSSGQSWDAQCLKEPQTCVSGFGARAMGTQREWTAQGLRGASVGAELSHQRRCARRAKGFGEGEGAAAVRCCQGAPQAAVKLPEVPELPSFRSQRMEDAELARIVRSIPELLKIHEEPRFLSAQEAAGAYARSDTSRDGIKFASQPILWSPERGVEVLVLSGQSKRTGFVLALFPQVPIAGQAETAKGGRADQTEPVSSIQPGIDYRLASSMLFLRDKRPIALAFRPSTRRELLWTMFWGSRTDEGYISWRPEEKRVVIVQK